GLRLGAGARPDVFQERARRCRRLGHLVVEPVVGKGRKAEQLGTLGAQGDHLGDQRAVVGCPAALAAAGPGLQRLLAQFATRRELKKVSTEERASVMAYLPGCP